MSKSGNNFYYLQDELGSPMYMTGTDGMAVGSYAFDDYGRNIDPFTGNRRDKNQKHAYTTNGNIIQPFAFTGYQEDEVSGLKFAQARYYSADNGRFQSEDNVKGFVNRPFTLNHYGYCWANPIVLVDNDGNLPQIIEAASSAINEVSSEILVIFDKVGGYLKEHENQIKAVGVGAAAVGLSIVVSGIPVVGPAASGAILSAGIESASQIWSDGKVTDIKKVGVHAVAGAVTGCIPGAGKIVEKGLTKVAPKVIAVGTRYLVNASLNGAVAAGTTFADAVVEGKKIDSSIKEDMGVDFFATFGLSIFGQAFEDTAIKTIKNHIEMHETAAGYAKAGIGITEQVDFLHQNRAVHSLPSKSSKYWYKQERLIAKVLKRFLFAAEVSETSTEEVMGLLIPQWIAKVMNKSNGECGD